MASLDAGHKRDMLPYLEALPARFDLPLILVSHSVSEMARLADNVVLLEQGRITATGPAKEILRRESVEASDWSFEATSILDVQVRRQLPELKLTEVSHGAQVLLVPAMGDTRPGDDARLAVRAGDVVVATDEPAGLSVRNVLRGVVASINALPDSAFASVSIDVEGTALQATLTVHAARELGLEAGMPVYALLKTATFDRSL
jgi:molybdate transport system ATP-binding protein